jgi:hypothetical protein
MRRFSQPATRSVQNILGRYGNVRKKNMICDITEELSSSKGLLSNFVVALCNCF